MNANVDVGLMEKRRNVAHHRVWKNHGKFIIVSEDEKYELRRELFIHYLLMTSIVAGAFSLGFLLGFKQRG